MKIKFLQFKNFLFLFIFLFFSCQGKTINDLLYVKSYELFTPYVFIMKVNHYSSSDPGSFCLGFMIKDSDGKYLEDKSIVEDIQITSPSGIVYTIDPQSPYHYNNVTLIGSGVEIYGSAEYMSQFNQGPSYMWYYVDTNTHDAETGYYNFSVKITGKLVTAKAVFEPFYLNGVRTDPLENQFPSQTVTPNTISFDKNTRILEWDKVPNAENYRIYIFKSYLNNAKEEYKDLLENSLSIRISNIWNARPDNENRIQYQIPDDVNLLPGQYYFFRIDAYIYGSSLLIQDTNYINASRKNILIP